MDEEVRGVRQRKKNTDPACCPVCGITVRPNEMDQHYALEMERLNKLSKKSKITSSNLSPRHKDGRDSTGVSGALPAGSSTSASDSAASNGATVKMIDKDCWTTYQRIKNNRSSRLKVSNGDVYRMSMSSASLLIGAAKTGSLRQFSNY